MRKYENPEIDITRFTKENIILTSIVDGGYNGEEEADDFANLS